MMEIRVVGNYYLSVLADLEVKFKCIDAQVECVLHSLYGILRHKACASSMSLYINIIRHIQIIYPGLSETSGHCHRHSSGILARSGSEIMFTCPGALPGCRFLAERLILRLHLCNMEWRILLYLIHLSHRLAVLIPLYLPRRIPVPYVGDDAVRMLQGLAWLEYLHLEIPVLTYRLIIPGKFSRILGIYLVSSRTSVCTMVCIPPGSAYRCYIMLGHIIAVGIWLAEMVVS